VTQAFVDALRKNNPRLTPEQQDFIDWLDNNYYEMIVVYVDPLLK